MGLFTAADGSLSCRAQPECQLLFRQAIPCPSLHHWGSNSGHKHCRALYPLINPYSPKLGRMEFSCSLPSQSDERVTPRLWGSEKKRFQEHIHALDFWAKRRSILAQERCSSHTPFTLGWRENQALTQRHVFCEANTSSSEA